MWMIPAVMRMNCWQKHCFFNITVRLDNGRDFSNVLNTSNPQLEHSLSNVSGISWGANRASESEHLGAHWVEGFVHYVSSNRTRLGCLKRVLPEKSLSDTGEIYKLPLKLFIPAAAMPAQKSHHKTINILKRPCWIFSLAVQSKGCETTFAVPAGNFFRSTHPRHGLSIER